MPFAKLKSEVRSTPSVEALDLASTEGNLLLEYSGEQDVMRSPNALVRVFALRHSLKRHFSRFSRCIGEDDRADVGSEYFRNLIERETGYFGTGASPSPIRNQGTQFGSGGEGKPGESWVKRG